MKNRVTHLTVVLAPLVLIGCDSESHPNQTETAARTSHPLSIERVVFPDNLRSGYAPVDAFISEALSTCVKGDYESFRLLWNARQEPLHREEFEQGWRAVQTVRVRAIEKVVLPTDDSEDAPIEHDAVDDGLASDVSFVLLVEAAFDAQHPVGRRQANREFVLLVMREHSAWRLGRAPQPVRDWIRRQVNASSGDRDVAAGPPEQQHEP